VSALALAWIYFRWGQNLWLVFSLHALANLAGALYMSGDVAVDDGLFTTLLLATIGLGVVTTLLQARLPWSDRIASRAGPDHYALP
jgi:hypothetical protein